jgi:hypothetical protein
MNWRILLNKSARAEERYWLTMDEQWLTMAHEYLDKAKAMPR